MKYRWRRRLFRWPSTPQHLQRQRVRCCESAVQIQPCQLMLHWPWRPRKCWTGHERCKGLPRKIPSPPGTQGEAAKLRGETLWRDRKAKRRKVGMRTGSKNQTDSKCPEPQCSAHMSDINLNVDRRTTGVRFGQEGCYLLSGNLVRLIAGAGAGSDAGVGGRGAEVAVAAQGGGPQT